MNSFNCGPKPFPRTPCPCERCAQKRQQMNTPIGNRYDNKSNDRYDNKSNDVKNSCDSRNEENNSMPFGLSPGLFEYAVAVFAIATLLLVNILTIWSVVAEYLFIMAKKLYRSSRNVQYCALGLFLLILLCILISNALPPKSKSRTRKIAAVQQIKIKKSVPAQKPQPPKKSQPPQLPANKTKSNKLAKTASNSTQSTANTPTKLPSWIKTNKPPIVPAKTDTKAKSNVSKSAKPTCIPACKLKKNKGNKEIKPPKWMGCKTTPVCNKGLRLPSWLIKLCGGDAAAGACPKDKGKQKTKVVLDEDAKKIYDQSKLYAIPGEMKEPPFILVYLYNLFTRANEQTTASDANQ